MTTQWTPERLVAFSDRVAQAFRDKKVTAPVHLCGGNEQQVIKAFETVSPLDYVFSTWRSSYHALLHGLPEEYVFSEILLGRSMYLSSVEPRFLAGSIVAGMCSIAVGVALGIKLMHGTERVHLFLGDMAARSGQYHEAIQYAESNALPLRIIIEDNGLSTDTPTDVAWGTSLSHVHVHRYNYVRNRPHVGIGEHVSF